METAASLSSFEALLKRDRARLVFGIALTTLLAWAYMVREARAMTQSGVCECAGMAMTAADGQPWTAVQLVALLVMWSEMMVAMMLPSATPMILMFASVSRQRQEQQRPYVPTAVFVGGYLTAWCGFSAVAAVLQAMLHRAAVLSPMMVSTSRWLGGALFICAGVFQFTRWKNACLVRCANPLGFLLTEWREGVRGAFVMGLRHGAFCLGCCWFLMLLLFIFGVMNILWIAVLTLYVLLEKAAGKNVWLGRVAGVVMCGMGVWQWWRA